MSQRGQAVYLFNNQSYIPGGQASVDSSDTLQMGENNAVTVFVFVAGSSVSVDVTVLGAALNGGFLALPDPNATQKSISASVTFDCLVGSDNVKVRLANLSGSFQNGQGVTILVQPYLSPGVRQRPNYYDRNTTNQTQVSTQNAIAPHAPTVRWSYTVPSGRKAMVDDASVFTQRIAAATTAVTADTIINYTPSTGSLIGMLRAVLLTNGVGDFKDNYQAGMGILLPGDQLSCTDVDTSTGGTMTFISGAKILEFDA